MDIKKIIEDLDVDVPVIVLEGMDEAVIGITNDDKVVYSIDKICEIISRSQNMDIAEASEYVYASVLPGFEFGDFNPVFMYELKEDEISKD